MSHCMTEKKDFDFSQSINELFAEAGEQLSATLRFNMIASELRMLSTHVKCFRHVPGCDAIIWLPDQNVGVRLGRAVAGVRCLCNNVLALDRIMLDAAGENANRAGEVARRLGWGLLPARDSAEPFRTPAESSIQVPLAVDSLADAFRVLCGAIPSIYPALSVDELVKSVQANLSKPVVEDPKQVPVVVRLVDLLKEFLASLSLGSEDALGISRLPGTPNASAESDVKLFEAETSTAEPAVSGRQICKFFASGRCKHGQRCRFLHITGSGKKQQAPKKAHVEVVASVHQNEQRTFFDLCGEEMSNGTYATVEAEKIPLFSSEGPIIFAATVRKFLRWRYQEFCSQTAVVSGVKATYSAGRKKKKTNTVRIEMMKGVAAINSVTSLVQLVFSIDIILERACDPKQLSEWRASCATDRSNCWRWGALAFLVSAIPLLPVDKADPKLWVDHCDTIQRLLRVDCLECDTKKSHQNVFLPCNHKTLISKIIACRLVGQLVARMSFHSLPHTDVRNIVTLFCQNNSVQSNPCSIPDWIQQLFRPAQLIDLADAFFLSLLGMETTWNIAVAILQKQAKKRSKSCLSGMNISFAQNCWTEPHGLAYLNALLEGIDGSYTVLSTNLIELRTVSVVAEKSEWYRLGTGVFVDDIVFEICRVACQKTISITGLKTWGQLTCGEPDLATNPPCSQLEEELQRKFIILRKLAGRCWQQICQWPRLLSFIHGTLRCDFSHVLRYFPCLILSRQAAADMSHVTQHVSFHFMHESYQWRWSAGSFSKDKTRRVEPETSHLAIRLQGALSSAMKAPPQKGKQSPAQPVITITERDVELFLAPFEGWLKLRALSCFALDELLSPRIRPNGALQSAISPSYQYYSLEGSTPKGYFSTASLMLLDWFGAPGHVRATSKEFDWLKVWLQSLERMSSKGMCSSEANKASRPIPFSLVSMHLSTTFQVGANPFTISAEGLANVANVASLTHRLRYFEVCDAKTGRLNCFGFDRDIIAASLLVLARTKSFASINRQTASEEEKALEKEIEHRIGLVSCKEVFSTHETTFQLLIGTKYEVGAQIAQRNLQEMRHAKNEKHPMESFPARPYEVVWDNLPFLDGPPNPFNPQEVTKRSAHNQKVWRTYPTGFGRLPFDRENDAVAKLLLEDAPSLSKPWFGGVTTDAQWLRSWRDMVKQWCSRPQCEPHALSFLAEISNRALSAFRPLLLQHDTKVSEFFTAIDTVILPTFRVMLSIESEVVPSGKKDDRPSSVDCSFDLKTPAEKNVSLMSNSTCDLRILCNRFGFSLGTIIRGILEESVSELVSSKCRRTIEAALQIGTSKTLNFFSSELDEVLVMRRYADSWTSTQHFDPTWLEPRIPLPPQTARFALLEGDETYMFGASELRCRQNHLQTEAARTFATARRFRKLYMIVNAKKYGDFAEIFSKSWWNAMEKQNSVSIGSWEYLLLREINPSAAFFIIGGELLGSNYFLQKKPASHFLNIQNNSDDWVDEMCSLVEQSASEQITGHTSPQNLFPTMLTPTDKKVKELLEEVLTKVKFQNTGILVMARRLLAYKETAGSKAAVKQLLDKSIMAHFTALSSSQGASLQIPLALDLSDVQHALAFAWGELRADTVKTVEKLFRAWLSILYPLTPHVSKPQPRNCVNWVPKHPVAEPVMVGTLKIAANPSRTTLDRFLLQILCPPSPSRNFFNLSLRRATKKKKYGRRWNSVIKDLESVRPDEYCEENFSSSSSDDGDEAEEMKPEAPASAKGKGATEEDGNDLEDADSEENKWPFTLSRLGFVGNASIHSKAFSSTEKITKIDMISFLHGRPVPAAINLTSEQRWLFLAALYRHVISYPVDLPLAAPKQSILRPPQNACGTGEILERTAVLQVRQLVNLLVSFPSLSLTVEGALHEAQEIAFRTAAVLILSNPTVGRSFAWDTFLLIGPFQFLLNPRRLVLNTDSSSSSDDGTTAEIPGEDATVLNDFPCLTREIVRTACHRHIELMLLIPHHRHAAAYKVNYLHAKVALFPFQKARLLSSSYYVELPWVSGSHYIPFSKTYNSLSCYVRNQKNFVSVLMREAPNFFKDAMTATIQAQWHDTVLSNAYSWTFAGPAITSYHESQIRGMVSPNHPPAVIEWNQLTSQFVRSTKSNMKHSLEAFSDPREIIIRALALPHIPSVWLKHAFSNVKDCSPSPINFGDGNLDWRPYHELPTLLFCTVGHFLDERGLQALLEHRMHIWWMEMPWNVARLVGVFTFGVIPEKSSRMRIFCT